MLTLNTPRSREVSTRSLSVARFVVLVSAELDRSGHDGALGDVLQRLARLVQRESFEASARFDGRAVAERPEGRPGVLDEPELAVVGTTVQALIALTAFGGAGNNHSVANLHPPYERTDRFDDSDAAVIRHFRDSGIGVRECGGHDRAAGNASLGADQDLARVEREERQFLDSADVPCRT